MIEKMMNFNRDKWSAFFFVSFVGFLLLYLTTHFYLKARSGFGFKAVFKAGQFGELIPSKKATITQIRNIWIVIYTLLAIFLFYIYMVSRDSKLWS